MKPIHRKKHPLFLLAALTFSCLWSQSTVAYIHAPTVSSSHELEEHTVILHDYLHDNYDSTYGAHDLEEAADALHEALHLWSEGSATETQVGTELVSISQAWKEFKSQIKSSELLSSDDALNELFKDTRGVFREVSFLLRKSSDLDYIKDEAPETSHELEEASVILHDYLHDNYESTYGAHDLEDASHSLHEALHNWSLGMETEDTVADLFDVVNGAWKYFGYQIDEAGLSKGLDSTLNQLVRETRHAVKEVKSLLRKAD